LPGTRNYLNHLLDKFHHRFRTLFYKLIKKAPPVISGKRLLIVRLDAIGDYVLFRNGLRPIRNHSDYKGYKISLLGNILWKDIAENLDANVIDSFFWINPNLLYNRSQYSYARSKLLLKLKLCGFSKIIHPVHSRMLDVDEFIAALGADHRIASTGDGVNYQPGEKAIADKIYNYLIEVPDQSVFEFIRNSHFISRLTGTDAVSIKLRMEIKAKVKTGNKIIITPGAGHATRRWPAEKFAIVMKMMAANLPGLKFYICGSKADEVAAAIIEKEASGCQVENKCGKLTLFQFAEQIGEATLLISNESSAVHIAAAIETSTICISNGNMFGRFNPYPEEMNKNIITLYSDNIFNDRNKFQANVEKNKVHSNYDISELDTTQVFNACLTLLKPSSH
jgi:ADP-heptose:LPS heptosyltransferase